MEKYRIVKDGNGFFRIQKSQWGDIEYRREYKKIEHAVEQMKDLINKRESEKNYYKIEDIMEAEE